MLLLIAIEYCKSFLPGQRLSAPATGFPSIKLEQQLRGASFHLNSCSYLEQKFSKVVNIGSAIVCTLNKNKRYHVQQYILQKKHYRHQNIVNGRICCSEGWYMSSIKIYFYLLYVLI